MTAVAKPEPGTAVAKSQQREERLSPAQRAKLDEIRSQNALTTTLMSESWGSDMAPGLQRAFAEYIRRFHLDISEVDNLGGKPYKNGYYYRRKIDERRSAGEVEWSSEEMIGPNPDLEAMANDESVSAEYREKARIERDRRRWERIRWDVPADATHACVVRVKLKGDQNPLEGCDFITPKRTKKTKWGEKIADPVGAEEPEKTVITRAWRRCGLLVAAQIPELKAEEKAMDDAAEVIGADAMRLANEMDARVAAHEQRSLTAGNSHVPLSAMGDLSDGYGAVDPSRASEVDGKAEVREVRSESSEAGKGSTNTGGGVSEETGKGETQRGTLTSSSDSADEPIERTKDEQVICTIADWKGHPLWHIPTSELELVELTAAQSPRTKALAEAAASVLKDRAAGHIEAPTNEESRAFKREAQG